MLDFANLYLGFTEMLPRNYNTTGICMLEQSDILDASDFPALFWTKDLVALLNV